MSDVTLKIAKEYADDEGWNSSPGEALREVRVGFGLTLREAATILGLTASDLGRWERDKEHVRLDVLGWAVRRMTALAMESRRRHGRDPLRWAKSLPALPHGGLAGSKVTP